LEQRRGGCALDSPLKRVGKLFVAAGYNDALPLFLIHYLVSLNAYERVFSENMKLTADIDRHFGVKAIFVPQILNYEFLEAK
jgi:hypothetical protein